jgi:hypothetical protein
MSQKFVKVTVTAPTLPQPPAATFYGRSWETEHGPVRTVLAVLQPGRLCHRVYARPDIEAQEAAV